MRALVLALCLLIGIPGCGGKKVSTGPSRNTVSFANEYVLGYAPLGNAGLASWIFIIDIPTAHQHFELPESERKVVELVADDGSTEFEFTVTRKGTEDTKMGVASIGDQVSIGSSGGLRGESWRILINGEPMEG